jgi:hypothetical protein
VEEVSRLADAIAKALRAAATVPIIGPAEEVD